jgi:2-keto-3-deoxy-L-rhamnonate aldolase RhmA
MKENSIRRAVREGRAALGTGLKEFASRGVPWIIEAAGFDYCAIDHEHGAFDMETIANLASWFQATNVSAIVRIHKSFAHLIPGILDQGIMGIQVSEVENAKEARAIVRLAKYPPIVDMIAYGHSDLSAQLGVHLDLEHPKFKAAVRRIAAACNAHGKLARGSAETEAQIEEYWQLGCKVLNLPGNDVSTYLDGMKARAARAHARLKSIGVPTP